MKPRKTTPWIPSEQEFEAMMQWRKELKLRLPEKDWETFELEDRLFRSALERQVLAENRDLRLTDLATVQYKGIDAPCLEVEDIVKYMGLSDRPGHRLTYHTYAYVKAHSQRCHDCGWKLYWLHDHEVRNSPIDLGPNLAEPLLQAAEQNRDPHYISRKYGRPGAPSRA